jgi:predicted O-linked N-acetylglucosamine transferase (SPINDLY family)
MPTIPEALAIAIQDHRMGRLREAETTYRQILASDPNHHDAWRLLGLIACQVGKYQAGVECIGRALTLMPDWAEAHFDLGNAWKDQGKLDLAMACYQRALQLNPDYAEAHNNLGLAWRDHGDLEKAAACYQESLRLRPGSALAHNNLANVLTLQGKPDEAAACYQRALQLNPGFAEAHNNLGNVFRGQGKLSQAAACFQRALELKPGFAEVHNNLGNVFKDQGKPDEAVACYRRALQRNPDYAEAHNNLGNVFKDQGKLDEAAECYQRALERKPDYAMAHYNLGLVYHDRGHLSEAVACYRQALNWDPAYAEAHNNLGNALKDQGNLDEAVACCRRALELKPDLAEAHSSLGALVQEQGTPDEAIACYRRALELKPDLAEAHHNLGNLLMDRGKLDEAVANYRRALELKPNSALVHNGLGDAFREQGKLDEAVACFRRALDLKPSSISALCSLVHEFQHICCWDDLRVLSERVIEAIDQDSDVGLAPPVPPLAFLALPLVTTAEQQWKCARQWVNRRLKAKGEFGYDRAHSRTAAPKTKMTIGYLSADFHSHAVAYLIAELIEKHDRSRFAIHGYSYGPDDGSAMRGRLVRAFDRFVDVRNLSHLQAAQRIAGDEVQILVDLTGYTKNARTRILALRPAPIQVNFLGYPGTMGASFIDYILVDDYIVPSDQQPAFTEKLVHLPGCYQVNDSQREIASDTPSRAECGLPEAGFVFCSFNNNFKITPEIFGVWMELLKEVPGSVLWLLEGNRFAPVNLCREARRRGVAAERLVFGPHKPLAEHLARHRLADLFLDTFPYNAHTTASDALWAGCPLLTMAGETFPSRVAASLLRALGLPELITRSLADYHETALRLARNAGLLAALRERLEAGRKESQVFNADGFARNLEKAYRTMWEIHASGEAPRAFTVSPV